MKVTPYVINKGTSSEYWGLKSVEDDPRDSQVLHTPRWKSKKSAIKYAEKSGMEVVESSSKASRKFVVSATNISCSDLTDEQANTLYELSMFAEEVIKDIENDYGKKLSSDGWGEVMDYAKEITKHPEMYRMTGTGIDSAKIHLESVIYDIYEDDTGIKGIYESTEIGGGSMRKFTVTASKSNDKFYTRDFPDVKPGQVKVAPQRGNYTVFIGLSDGTIAYQWCESKVKADREAKYARDTVKKYGSDAPYWTAEGYKIWNPKANASTSTKRRFSVKASATAKRKAAIKAASDREPIFDYGKWSIYKQGDEIVISDGYMTDYAEFTPDGDVRVAGYTPEMRVPAFVVDKMKRLYKKGMIVRPEKWYDDASSAVKCATDPEVEDLWSQFADVPMNPDTEEIEEDFMDFPAGTNREEIWHWFDKNHSKGVAYLLYGSESIKCATDADDKSEYHLYGYDKDGADVDTRYTRSAKGITEAVDELFSYDEVDTVDIYSGGMSGDGDYIGTVTRDEHDSDSAGRVRELLDADGIKGAKSVKCATVTASAWDDYTMTIITPDGYTDTMTRRMGNFDMLPRSQMTWYSDGTRFEVTNSVGETRVFEKVATDDAVGGYADLIEVDANESIKCAVDPDAVRFTADAMYERNRGLADSEYSDDWSKIEEFSHDALMRGFWISIKDNGTGDELVISPDEYNEAWDNGAADFDINDEIVEFKQRIVESSTAIECAFRDPTIDKEAVRELVLTITNDGDLYREKTTPILENLKKKAAKGKYDRELAVKLWQYLADEGVKRYGRDFGPGYTVSWLNPATRQEIAKELRDYYEEQVLWDVNHPEETDTDLVTL